MLLALSQSGGVIVCFSPKKKKSSGSKIRNLMRNLSQGTRTVENGHSPSGLLHKIPGAELAAGLGSVQTSWSS